MRKTLHKYIFMRRYRLANTLGQRLERLVCVAAFDKDDAIEQILDFFKYEVCEKSDLDYIDEVGLEHFVGILGVDIPRRKFDPLSEALKKAFH